MNDISQRLDAYIRTHPFDPGSSGADSVLDQLYQAYADFHETDPPKIRDSFHELNELLSSLPLPDIDAVFDLACGICVACERKAFLDGVQYGAHLMR